MPLIDLGGLEFQYSTPDFSIIVWALITAPVFDLFMFYFEKPCSAIIMIIYFVSLTAMAFYSLLNSGTASGYFALVLMVIITNGFFIERLARHTLKKDIQHFI